MSGGGVGTAGSAGLLCALAYLIGSIPVPWLTMRWLRGVDIRDYGTGNVGTSNVYRHAGIRVAALTGPAQFAQGLLPVLLARAAGGGELLLVVTGLLAVAGNGWPVWLRFEGGRGVGVATGAVAAIHLTGLVVLLSCYLVGAMAGAIAVGVLSGFVLLPLAGLLAGDPTRFAGFAGMLVLILWRRLSGLIEDHHLYGGDWGELAGQRLLHDRRPGRPLVGPRPGKTG